LSNNTAYQAATDGFAVGIISFVGDSADVRALGYTDSNSSPATLVVANQGSAASVTTGYAGVSFPVKKGDYWKINLTTTSGSPSRSIRWMPLGT
jgi:hypothetical protein